MSLFPLRGRHPTSKNNIKERKRCTVPPGRINFQSCIWQAIWPNSSLLKVPQCLEQLADDETPIQAWTPSSVQSESLHAPLNPLEMVLVHALGRYVVCFLEVLLQSSQAEGKSGPEADCDLRGQFMCKGGPAVRLLNC